MFQRSLNLSLTPSQPDKREPRLYRRLDLTQYVGQICERCIKFGVV